MGPKVQRDQPSDLGWRHLRRGDVDAGNARIHHHLGLAQGRATDADRTGVHLHPSDADGFVCLRVRAERHAYGARMRRHRRDVALERVEIDEQRRRVQTVAAAGLTDERGVGAQSLCYGCYPRKWQATRCPGFTSRIAGSSTRQRASA